MTILLTDREKAIVRGCALRREAALATAERERQAIEDLLAVVIERAGGELAKGYKLAPDCGSLVQLEPPPAGAPSTPPN